jgi:hypothetical protein
VDGGVGRDGRKEGNERGEKGCGKSHVVPSFVSLSVSVARGRETPSGGPGCMKIISKCGRRVGCVRRWPVERLVLSSVSAFF